MHKKCQLTQKRRQKVSILFIEGWNLEGRIKQGSKEDWESGRGQKKDGPQRPYLGWHWLFLTRSLEVRVIILCIIYLCAKYLLSSMVGSVLRSPCPRCQYLEDIDGSWPGTWRIESSLISLIIMKCNYLLLWKISARHQYSIVPWSQWDKVVKWKEVV